MNSVVAAQEACRRGVVFEAQYFSTEPFYAATQIRRCYKCHRFGHIARYCNNRTRCGHCAGAAHEGGEANCPEKGEGGQKRCVNYSHNHLVWDRACPIAIKEVKRAKEAYKKRPYQFDIIQGTRFKEPISASQPQPQQYSTPGQAPPSSEV